MNINSQYSGGGAGYSIQPTTYIGEGGISLPLDSTISIYGVGGCGVNKSNSTSVGFCGCPTISNHGGGGSTQLSPNNPCNGGAGVAFIEVPSGYRVTGTSVAQVGTSNIYKITATTTITFTTV